MTFMTTTSKKKELTIKAKDFDAAFELGDVTQYLDLKTLKSKQPIQRINLDMPRAILAQVDKEAARIGTTRTALLKMWISDRLRLVA